VEGNSVLGVSAHTLGSRSENGVRTSAVGIILSGALDKVGRRKMKVNSVNLAAGFVFVAMCSQTSIAAESAEALYKQCEAKQTTAEQRKCYPVVKKQSEIELVAAEKKVRADMVELEGESESSRSLHPVMAFDKAERAYRAFRTAESHRVLTSYGSGNGGDLAANQAAIEMNLTRIRQLKGQ
jgi:uncharacterized protein YecT (DUF1311 family)